jgi:hypothetical protein
MSALVSHRAPRRRGQLRVAHTGTQTREHAALTHQYTLTQLQCCLPGEEGMEETLARGSSGWDNEDRSPLQSLLECPPSPTHQESMFVPTSSPSSSHTHLQHPCHLPLPSLDPHPLPSATGNVADSDFQVHLTSHQMSKWLWARCPKAMADKGPARSPAESRLTITTWQTWPRQSSE